MTDEAVDLARLMLYDDAVALLDVLGHVSACCRRSVATRLFDRIVDLLCAERCSAGKLAVLVGTAAGFLGVDAAVVEGAMELVQARIADAEECRDLEDAYNMEQKHD